MKIGLNPTLPTPLMIPFIAKYTILTTLKFAIMKTKTFAAFLMVAMLLSSIQTEAAKPKVAKNDKERCEATTTKGTRCKLIKEKGSKYCEIHAATDDASKQCQATTKAGTQCKRAAKKKGYCEQHYQMKKAKKL